MADISLTQDSFDDSDEGVYEQGDSLPGISIDGETFPLIILFDRIQKYAKSDIIHNGLMIWKILTELFKSGPEDYTTSYLPDIMSIVSRLADEGNKIVRKGLIDQIPNLAGLAKERSATVPVLRTVVSEYFLPMIVRNLGTDEHFSRKAAETSLFSLMELGHVSKMEAEIQVCPTILALSREECSTDDNLLAVTLMSRMANLLGRDVTERVFLDRFAERCKNSAFYVRKTCASHIGDFCTVVGKNACENILLPCYIGLCSDEMWAVRKTCAEVAMSVSCACQATVRREVLSPIFIKLLQDDSRCVRISAFQTLGPFISTFADSAIYSLFYNNLGELMSVDADGREFRVISTSSLSKLYKFSETNFKEEDFIYDVYQGKEDCVTMNPLIEVCSDEVEVANTTDIAIDIPNLSDGPPDLIQQERKREEIIIQKNMQVMSKAMLKEESGKKNVGLDGNESVTQEAPVEEDPEKFKEIVETVKNALLNFSAALPGEEQKSETSEPCLKCDSGIEMSNATAKNLENVASGSGDLCDVDISRSSSADVSSLENICSLKSSNSDTTISSGTNALVRTEVVERHGDVFREEEDENKENLSKSPVEDGLHEYNSYNYWYIRPELPVDLSIVNGAAKSPKKKNEANAGHSLHKESGKSTDTTATDANTSQSNKDTEANSKEFTQEPIDENATWDGVPRSLISHFVSMTNPALAQEIDNDMALHCAYSLPAVALTLGSKNWHLLKETVETLASSMHYKVRRTVASGLHELAVILGPDIATNHLTPIFDGFIKDLDEVRIGVLKHLAHFLKLINPTKRNTYLSRFADFLQSDNELNWRYRQELAQQLCLAVPLFRPSDTAKHMTPIAQVLLSDKVDAVRQTALGLLTELLNYISTDHDLTPRLLIILAERFAHAKKWKRRQTFALLCSELLAANAIPIDLFASDMMPHLVDLSWDPVANVRLVVARTLSKQIITNAYFSDPNNQHFDSLETVLRRLQSDKDQDVRQAALIENYTIFPLHKQKKVKTT